jgi:tRNA 2-thiocytidine biosynthesis protein TtcA
MSSQTMKKHLLKTMTRLAGKAIGDFGLIEDGDRILVALSGGKDSWSLLHILMALRQRAPVNYELAATTVHPGASSFDHSALGKRLAQDGINHYVIPGNIVGIVNDKLDEGTSPCSLCSRLRRGMLYTFAARGGWNKIALGHHLDDFVETFLLNLFFNGSIKGMSPNLLADDGHNRVIRPLVYIKEAMTREFAQSLGVPIIGCSCPYQEMGGSRRQWAKALLARLEKDVPDIKSSILAGMGNVRHRHLVIRKRD